MATAKVRKTFLKIVDRLVAAGMSQEKALREVATAYCVDLKQLTHKYEKEKANA